MEITATATTTATTSAVLTSAGLRCSIWQSLIHAALLLLAFASAPAFATQSLEERVQEIERLGVTAHWRESDTRIAALAAQQAALSAHQRQRVEYVRLRNAAIAGRNDEALRGLVALLKQEMPPAFRVRVYTTGISIAANVENWTLAFNWLDQGLAHLSQAPEESARLLGGASYLHTLVGEDAKALELALRALRQIESADSEPRAVCMALNDVALAEDHAGNYAEAGRWRRRQVEECKRAGDLVFAALGKYGLGKTAARQGQHADALRWGREALAEMQASGFESGAMSATLVIADSLIALEQELDEAGAILAETRKFYGAQGAQLAIAETERLLAQLARQRGDTANAYTHLERAMTASEAAERDARRRRVAYLQVQFDIQQKEQQIALLEAEKKVADLQVVATHRRQLMLGTVLVGLVVIALLLLALLRSSFADRRRYRWQSERDSLTRLYNYQQVRKLGEVAFAQARRSGQPFTAIVTDIDQFKQVNDRYGHAAGDEALRMLGVWINEVIRPSDIGGRSGGDEFTILLEADAIQADVILQRLRNRIAPITVFGQTFRFTISAGISQAGTDTDTLEQLIHEADQGLYGAKHAGRDRVVHAGGESDGATVAAASLVVVGSGIQFGRHTNERCLSEIREAQVVFCLADPFALAMVRELRPDAVDLGAHYAAGKDRRQTYREMDAAIMGEVRAGKRVCAVFYGHPGVFADVPHGVIRKARAEGISARMEPGISAEACLYADLGIDPGQRGVQSMEATQFLVRDRQPDTAGLVLLWQVALSGDLSHTRLHAEPEALQALVDKLLRWYPPDHEVILYEAARLPIESPRIQRLPLRELPTASYAEHTTLVIPPLPDVAAPTAASDTGSVPAGS